MIERTVLIKNARVWPDFDGPILENGRVLIRGSRIAKVGRFHARADETIDADGCYLLPGLIQTHVHCCQTLFRGAAEDLTLLPWLRQRIWPLEAAHDEESLRASTLITAAELLRGGVTAALTLETVRHTGAVLETLHDCGLMAVVSHCLMDETGGYEPLVVPIDDALADCDLLLQRLRDHDGLRLAIAPRFALSCSAQAMRTAAEYARDRGLLIHTHCAEQIQEIEYVRRRTGLGNVEYLHSLGLSGPDVCLAHCVHVSDPEREILRQTDTRVLHCPSANMKLGSGIAPIPEYLEAGLSVSLGSDGAPCNNRLDLFTEMRLAGLLQKLRLGPQALPARRILRMATRDAARTLGWESEMGTLEPGKRANLILVDPSGPHVLPSDDPAATLVYACTASDVALTMVNGRILYDTNGWTTIDADRLRRVAVEQRKKLIARAKIHGPTGP
ncbi:MAG: amidohydrolase family protein [Kiritimatiellia bacterium]|nr:amidohydrolase family protein [Kiritimatiellia bacterium]